jgi:LytS/YehU family sensor histidine kinase
VRIDVPQSLRAIRIPALVVQPLVENAIKHGVAPSRTGGDVEVIASIVDGAGQDLLRIAVRNSGAPLQVAAPRPAGERVGVDNVRRRLAGHYGDMATLTLSADALGHTVAELSMPLFEHAHLRQGHGVQATDDHDAKTVARRSR